MYYIDFGSNEPVGCWYKSKLIAQIWIRII